MFDLDWFEFENAAKAKGFKTVCGIDEAGRGPLAGPVCAACVVLRDGEMIEGLNDSKKLTEKKREALFKEITEKAVDYSIAMASEKEIDEINILQATFLAMRRAFEGLTKVSPDYALIDGNKTPGLPIEQEAVVKGDARSASVAAASILAKVTRDRYMINMDKVYPQYCFSKHKGYGTKLHYQCLDEYGPSPVHRQTFLKKWQEGKSR